MEITGRNSFIPSGKARLSLSQCSWNSCLLVNF